MSDELRERFSQSQQTAQSSEFQSLENKRSEPTDQGVQQPKSQEPEEIANLKSQIRELEQMVSVEEKRGSEALSEAKSSYKEAKAQAPAKLAALEDQIQELEERRRRGEQLEDDFEEKQNRLKVSEIKIQRDLASKKNLIKELSEFPVARAFESELEAARAELRGVETKWQKQIASLGKGGEGASTAAPEIEEQRAKLNASELNQAFGELEKAHTEMLKANNRTARGSDQMEFKKAVSRFDKMSAAFKKDFLRADPDDQKKTLDKAGQLSALDKMSVNVKKGLLIESGTKSAELEGKFAVRIQRLVAQKAREFSQRGKFGKGAAPPSQRDKPREVVFNPLRKVLSKGKIQASSESRNSVQALPRVRKQDSSLGR